MRSISKNVRTPPEEWRRASDPSQVVFGCGFPTAEQVAFIILPSTTVVEYVSLLTTFIVGFGESEIKRIKVHLSNDL